ncbi:cell growth-regulating nucleolar protein isoform X2 [Erinaceus europaeus]|uniref:Cell growth-regulating nucleolar protein isoform X2 n=1 Tax=Erinaceus europaeus TaxID=9365 RepID=A0ABM3X672_ERIEU|nr:cell growth-regulating nucleolar protein isoform X2 [Erinaceus europaeus]
MVFFTCNACGESVKKVQVEKHVAVCPHCECLSCIDCGKDFWGDDYKSHVKCISEDQKYGGKGYEGKTYKGDAKQQVWLQKINELMKKPNVSPKVRDLLVQISGFDNVPRKKAKFQNWMKNSLKIYNESVLEQVWAVFSEASSSDQEPANNKRPEQPSQAPGAKAQAETLAKAPASKGKEATEKQAEVKKSKRERKEERQKNRKKEKKELKLGSQQENAAKSQKARKRQAGPEEGGEEGSAAQGAGKKRQRKSSRSEQTPAGGTEADAPRKRKRKDSQAEAECKKIKSRGEDKDEEEAENHEETPARGKFNWKGTIKAVLKQAPDHEIAVKKLRKKVLAQYHAVTNEHHKSEEELLVIFNRKISKNPSFKLLKDKVMLLK